MVTFDLLVSLSKNLISGGLSAAAFQFTTVWQRPILAIFQQSAHFTLHTCKKKKGGGHFSQILNVRPQGGFPGMPSASGNVQGFLPTLSAKACLQEGP